MGQRGACLEVNIPVRNRGENLREYAERLAIIYSETYNPEARKPIGQFFTPKEIGSFMSKQLDIGTFDISLLDPGAGTGTLSASFCDLVLENPRKFKLTIDLYESDKNILPFLEATLSECKKQFKKTGKELQYNIFSTNFISEGLEKSSSNLSNYNKVGPKQYDFVIANPPYYKIGKEMAAKYGNSHPNIYTLFMAIAIKRLKQNGEAIFITPRSFCSGLYYNQFREQLLKETTVKSIHIFELRDAVFHNEDILQENIIIKVKKEIHAKSAQVKISASKNGHFEDLTSFTANYEDVIYKKQKQTFIRIPISTEDLEILRLMDKWPNVLMDLGLDISTGPIVTFRAKEHLLNDTTSKQHVPLLWMHNMKGFEIEWPSHKNSKPIAIKTSDKTAHLLLPSKNYVLIKRFTSKEQTRRIYAVPFLKSYTEYESLGIENHVNYIHKINGALSVYEAFGLAALLNTVFMDRYFRAMNGNTQVNATDIRRIPMPSIDVLNKIGKIVYEHQRKFDKLELDRIVEGELETEKRIISMSG